MACDTYCIDKTNSVELQEAIDRRSRAIAIRVIQLPSRLIAAGLRPGLMIVLYGSGRGRQAQVSALR